MYGIEALLTGRRLGGRYRIDAVIGRGGMGAVYRATDERLGREVAVKVVAVPAADAAEAAVLRARFQHEARSAAALHHPNVVAVYDFGADAELGIDFLVMELLRGEDLATRMAAGRPPLATSEARAVLLQAARGLAAGHRAGLVHRDVKPANLFLEAGDGPGEAPTIRVLDFGIAVAAGSESEFTRLTQYGRSPFSPAYAAPEQLAGSLSVTAAADVFSLAAVGYHLLTGARCFTSADPARMVAEVASATQTLAQRAPALPATVRGALTRALARNPADRFPNAAAFAEALAGGARETHSGTAPPRAAPPRAAETAGDATILQQATPSPPHRAGAVPPRVWSRPRAQAAPAPARPNLEYTVAWQRPAVAPLATAAACPLDAPPRVGVLRRTARYVFDLIVSATIVGAFAGAWVLAASGVSAHLSWRVRAGVAASVLLAPLAVHRVTGRRARLWLLLPASLLATLGVVRALDPAADPVTRLVAVGSAQVVTCFVLAAMFPKRRRAWEHE